jgi:flotillin
MFLLLGLAVLAIAAVVVLMVAIMFRVVVPQDEVHIVNSIKESRAHGDQKAVEELLEGNAESKNQKSYGNVYYSFPSKLPIIGVVVKKLPLNVFQVNLDDYPSYDQDKVPFKVDFKSWFVISNPIVAAKRVRDMAELSSQLQEMLQGIVRKTMAGKTIKEIMESRSELRDIFMKEVGEQGKDWGVKLNSIEFTDIRDYDEDGEGEFNVIDDIKRVKASAIQKERRIAEASNEKEARLSEIQNKRQADLEDVIAKEQVETRDADRKKTVGIANEQAEQEIKEQAKLTKTKEIAVERAQEVGKAEYQKEVVVVEANAKKEFDIIQAEANKRTLEIEAEGQKQKEKLEGEGIASKTEQVGSAEASIIQKKGEAEAKSVEKMAEAKKKLQEALKVELGALLIQAQKEVGIENAKALQHADIRFLVNEGSKDSLASKLEGFMQNSDTFRGIAEKLGIDLYTPDFAKSVVDQVVEGAAEDFNVSEKTQGNAKKPKKQVEDTDDEELPA